MLQNLIDAASYKQLLCWVLIQSQNRSRETFTERFDSRLGWKDFDTETVPKHLFTEGWTIKSWTNVECQ